MQPFRPLYGSNQQVSAGASSAVVTIPIGEGVTSLHVVNPSGNIAHVRAFKSKDALNTPALAVATTGDYPVMDRMASTVLIEAGDDRVAYISPLGATLQIMVGRGF